MKVAAIIVIIPKSKLGGHLRTKVTSGLRVRLCTLFRKLGSLCILGYNNDDGRLWFMYQLNSTRRYALWFLKVDLVPCWTWHLRVGDDVVSWQNVKHWFNIDFLKHQRTNCLETYQTYTSICPWQNRPTFLTSKDGVLIQKEWLFCVPKKHFWKLLKTLLFQNLAGHIRAQDNKMAWLS